MKPYDKTALVLGILFILLGGLFCSGGPIGVAIGVALFSAGLGLIAAAYTFCGFDKNGQLKR